MNFSRIRCVPDKWKCACPAATLEKIFRERFFFFSRNTIRARCVSCTVAAICVRTTIIEFFAKERTRPAVALGIPEAAECLRTRRSPNRRFQKGGGPCPVDVFRCPEVQHGCFFCLFFKHYTSALPNVSSARKQIEFRTRAPRSSSTARLMRQTSL